MGKRIRLQLRFRTDAEALLKHNPSWTNKARVKTESSRKEKQPWSEVVTLLAKVHDGRQLLQERCRVSFISLKLQDNFFLPPNGLKTDFSPFCYWCNHLNIFHFRVDFLYCPSWKKLRAHQSVFYTSTVKLHRNLYSLISSEEFSKKLHFFLSLWYFLHFSPAYSFSHTCLGAFHPIVSFLL